MKNPRILIDCIERRIRYVLCINLIYFSLSFQFTISLLSPYLLFTRSLSAPFVFLPYGKEVEGAKYVQDG